MSAGTSYRLDTAEFELVSDLLESEYRGCSISRRARIVFVALEVVAYLLPVWIAGYIGSRIVGAPWAGGLLTWIPPMIGVLILLLILNAPLARQAWRQYRLAGKMRALRLLEDELTAEKNIVWRRVRIGLTLTAPLVLLGMSLRSLGSGQATWGERGVVLALCVALPAGLLLFDRLLERLRWRIDYYREVSEVRGRLRTESGGGPTEEIEVSEDLASRIHSIESVRLLQRRETAVLQLDRITGGDFAIAKKSEVRQALRGLSPADRLAVQEALEELASAPEVAAATEECEQLSLHVPGTNLVVRYMLAATARRIDVLSVAPLAEGSGAEDASS